MPRSMLGAIDELLERHDIPVNQDMRDIIRVMIYSKYIPIYMRENYNLPFRCVAIITNQLPTDMFIGALVNIFKHYKTYTVVMITSLSNTSPGDKLDHIYNEGEKVMLALMDSKQKLEYIDRINEEVIKLEGQRSPAINEKLSTRIANQRIFSSFQ